MYKDKIVHIMKSNAVSDIWKWSKPAHLHILVLCILNLVCSGSTLVITIATKGLIDGATSRIPELIWLNAIVLVISVIVIRLSVFFIGMLKTRINAVLLRDIRSMVLQRLMKKQYGNLNGYHSGELVNRLFSDVNVIKTGVLDIIPGLVSTAVTFFGAAAILISMDWRFAVVLIFGGVLGLLLILAFKKPMKERHKAVQESEGKLHSFLQETLENLRLIKASGSESRMNKQAESRQSAFMKAQLKKGYFSTGMNTVVNTIFQLSWLFCMLWGGLGIYNGVLTYGSLAAIIQLIGQIQRPIANAAGIAGQAYETVSSAERISELIDMPEEKETEKVCGCRLYENLSEIKIENMYFTYGRGEENVLKNVNCCIKPGDFAAVTGISGGGKSTLFQLLLGIYQPTGGSLSFNFHDGAEPAGIKTRSLFAYVPQGNTLFSGTLRENFTMFTDYATDEEIMTAAKASCIDGLIDELDNGLDTVIGERGIGLSEGQAQRVAVARALLSKSPILLLDESTSALDESTEAKMLSNISAMRSKTCLIVTHRRAALDICDYALHIEGGNLTVKDISQ